MTNILIYHGVLSLLIGVTVAFELDGYRRFRTRVIAGVLTFILWPLTLGGLISDSLKREPVMKALALPAHNKGETE